MAITPQGTPTEPGLTYVNIARSLPFQYTFRGDDITEFSPATRDLFENRDRELELSLININGAIPVGGVTMFGGLLAAIPFNYLPCDGRTLDTTEFADLFNVIGYRYGGSGAIFNLPLAVDYIPFGLGNDVQSRVISLGTDSKSSTGHTHTLNSHSSTGHVHTLNSHASTGHGHTLGASTGNGGVDHFHGGNTNSTSSTFHTHAYFKPNSGSNTTTGAANVIGSTGHTHDIGTGFASSFSHAHNAAANVNASTADTAHSHTASTTTADTGHTHNASASNTDAGHFHSISAIGFYFIIRYQ
jgi:microcystin-dependent protein